MRTFRGMGPLFGLLAALMPAGAAARVTDSAPAGFVVVLEADVAAKPGRVYDALVMQVGSWWSPDHTYSGEAANLSLEPRAGGCFCERLEGGGEVRHMAVTNAQPGKPLRMTGGLGPLQALAVSGSLTIELAGAEAGTKVTWTYRVAGYDPGGLEAWAGPVDQVLAEQLQRFHRFIETGAPGE